MRIFAPPRGKAVACTTDKPAALLAAEGKQERQRLCPPPPNAWTWLLSAPEVSDRAGFASESAVPSLPVGGFQPNWVGWSCSYWYRAAGGFVETADDT